MEKTEGIRHKDKDLLIYPTVMRYLYANSYFYTATFTNCYCITAINLSDALVSRFVDLQILRAKYVINQKQCSCVTLTTINIQTFYSH